MVFGSYAQGLPWVLAAAALVWAVSLARRDASIADVVWGALFVLLACVYAADQRPLSPRAILVLALVSAWGFRLTTHLGLRNLRQHRRGEGEDARYQTMRSTWGTRFPWVSAVTVFGLQAVLAWVISAPLYVAMRSEPAEIGGFALAGAVLWAGGFVCEGLADWQLQRFKADPGNRGSVLASGLWRYSRHPNYFGEFVLWWGFYLIALDVPGGWKSFVGPLLISVLLLRVSGVTLLEDHLRDTKPGYSDYVARTSAFVPWFPKS